jgi:hypothetical protein
MDLEARIRRTKVWALTWGPSDLKIESIKKRRRNWKKYGWFKLIKYWTFLPFIIVNNLKLTLKR